MLTQIKLKLSAHDDFRLHTNMSSLFHGYIMENISSDYAEKMHISALRPFSQSIVQENNEFYWYVSSINDEAYENILKMLLKVKSIKLVKKDIDIDIDIVNIYRKQTSFEKLFEENYFNRSNSRFIKIKFLTPTAFKSNGLYINMPYVGYILSSLINKYDSFSDKTKVYDENLMKELSEKVYIHDYRIMSRCFSVDGSKIPSFVGEITLKVCGSDSLVNFVNMLADFSEYSGLGMKTSLGMGQVQHILHKM